MFSLIFSTRFRAMNLKVLQVSRIPVSHIWMLPETYCSIGPLREFCDWIATDPVTGKLSSADGWAKKKGGKWVADRWARWPKFATVVSSDGPLDIYDGYISDNPLFRLIIIHLLTVEAFMGTVQPVSLSVGLMTHSQTRQWSLGLGNTAVNGVCLRIHVHAL